MAFSTFFHDVYWVNMPVLLILSPFPDIFPCNTSASFNASSSSFLKGLPSLSCCIALTTLGYHCVPWARMQPVAISKRSASFLGAPVWYSHISVLLLIIGH